MMKTNTNSNLSISPPFQYLVQHQENYAAKKEQESTTVDHQEEKQDGAATDSMNIVHPNDNWTYASGVGNSIEEEHRNEEQHTNHYDGHHKQISTSINPETNRSYQSLSDNYASTTYGYNQQIDGYGDQYHQQTEDTTINYPQSPISNLVSNQPNYSGQPHHYPAASNLSYGCFPGQGCYPAHSGYLDYSAYAIQTTSGLHNNQVSNIDGRVMVSDVAPYNRIAVGTNGKQTVPPVLLQSTLDKTNQTNCKVSGRNNPSCTSPQTRRPRGRPRKHPLPFSASLTQQQQQIQWDNYQHQQALLLQQQGEAVDKNSNNNIQSNLVVFPPGSYGGQQIPDTTEQKTTDNKTEKKSKKKVGVSPSECHEKVDKYLKQRSQLYGHDVFNQLQVLEYKLPQYSTNEEFYGYGGPFNLLSLGQRIQHVIDLHQEEDDDKKNTKDSLIFSTPQEILHSNLHPESSDGFRLNESFVFSYFTHKLPIRDLVVSRNHMAALCDDSTVFLYRHKTHPLVRTNVSKWERIDSLDGVTAIGIRLVSANLNLNWRQKYHEYRRSSLIQKIRQELINKNIKLPKQITDELITNEELEIFIEEHPDGILCCSYEVLDPDWLPEPVVLGVIDSEGGMRIIRCSGYYNYPKIINREETKEDNIHSDNEDGRPKRSITEIDGNTGLLTTADTSPRRYQIIRNYTKLDINEKIPDLTVQLNQSDGGYRVKATVQDLAFGELTEDFIESDAPEIPLIVYATASSEDSAFVKGKNVFIRFKNFPTGVSKIYCGPLGHTGIIMLLNGTIWSWQAEAGNKQGVKKFGVSINQVYGSLENRIVVDFMAVGAEFVALTSDGLIHEWNSYEPYLNKLTTTEPELIINKNRPIIPQPIEWTPNFQKTLLRNLQKPPNLTPYQVGCFSLFGGGILREPTAQLGNVKSNNSEPENTVMNTEDMQTQSTDDQHQEVSLDNTTKNTIENIVKDEDRNNTCLSEETLERIRQLEVEERYKKLVHEEKADKLARIYVMEGITLTQTQESGVFHAIENDLSDGRFNQYINAEDSYLLQDSIGNTSMNMSKFTLQNAQKLARKCSALGNPAAANPVIIACNRIRATRAVDDHLLREELDAMAVENPPTYRLITAPNSVIVAILQKTDMTELRKRLLLARPSTLVAIDDPEMLLDAITVFKPQKMSKALWKRKKQAATWKKEEDDKEVIQTLNDDTKIQEKAKRVRRKSSRRSRRGRPKGAARTKSESELVDQEQIPEMPMPNAAVNEKKILKQQHQENVAPKESDQIETMIEDGEKIPETRKRTRRQSQALDQANFFIPGINDTPETDKVWEEMLNLMDDTSGDEGSSKKHKKETARYTKRPKHVEPNLALNPEQIAIVLKTLKGEFPVLNSENEDYKELSLSLKEGDENYNNTTKLNTAN